MGTKNQKIVRPKWLSIFIISSIGILFPSLLSALLLGEIEDLRNRYFVFILFLMMSLNLLVSFILTRIRAYPGTQYSQVVELSHFVDPFDGTYKKKVTLPKNFKGNLYLAGLNVSSLQNKLVKVRFNMGLDAQSMVFNATVARALGITPQTDIQVLVIDLNSSPLSNLNCFIDCR